MTPGQIAAAFGAPLDTDATDLAPACNWCGTTAKGLTWRGDHYTCELCWQGGGGEYPDELAMRVSRKMSRANFAKLPRDSDGRPILPSLTWRAWNKLRH